MKGAWGWRHHYTIPAVILIAGIVSMAMILWIDRVSQKQRMNLRHLDAVMNMQIRTAIFHLQFDEFLNDDPREGRQKALRCIDNVVKSSHALLYGGESKQGVPLLPLEDPRLREDTEAIASQLTRIKEIALLRYENPKSNGTDSPLDQEFHAAFNDSIETARALEVLVGKSLVHNIVRTKRVLFVLVLTWTAAVVALSALLYNREMRRRRTEMELERACGEMEQKIRDRTSELFSVNRQLQEEVVERRQAEKALEDSRQGLRRLMDHLQSVREEERTWVAREIHDQLGQTLTSLSMELAWLEGKLSQKGVLSGHGLAETINTMSSSIDGAIELIHEISSELRPGVLDNIGLIAAIEWQAARFREKAGVECHLTLPTNEGRLDARRSTALFRIFQEVLTNVARHARATEVDISLTIDSAMLTMEVHDNGRGITESESSDARAFGILGMRERVAAFGGKFHIEGIEGQGTRVVLSMPLSSGDAPREKSDAEGLSCG